jgi:hypothetical protein
VTAHCHIAQVLPDGQIRAIYVHYAEPSAAIGSLLARHYAGAGDVSALLDLGDLSTLGLTPEDCRAYGRDRGETGTSARIYPDTYALIDAALTSSAVYLFREEQWFVWLGDGEWYQLKPSGYVTWHGPVVPYIEELIRTAIGLNRPFDQEEVIYPLWNAGFGFMLHLDERFQLYRDEPFEPRLWIVRPVQRVVTA